MKFSRFAAFATVIGFAGTASAVFPRAAFCTPPARVSYTVAPNLATGTFAVTATAEGVVGDSVSFAFPAWSPGWYVLTHAYQNVREVSATGDAGNAPLAVSHPDDYTWRVQTGGAKRVTLRYELAAGQPAADNQSGPAELEAQFGFFFPYLDKTHGFVPGPGSLMYVVDGKNAPCSITYSVPTGWKIASANTSVKNDPTTFTAPNYDVLADQPADLGAFERVDKTVQGVPFSVVLVGAENRDTTAFIRSVFRTAEATLNVFRVTGPPPFPRYVFHFRFPRINTDIEAGLEHLNGTVITAPRAVLRDPDMQTMSLIAHEFTHAWNVKRIRPVALGPFDYSKEVRVKDLWWSEGVTEYYAPRIVVAGGMGNTNFWRGYIAKNLSDLQNNPARKTVTLETASLKAWEGESEGFGGLSYYNKGMLVGLLLDIEMRSRTSNKIGLDDIMKTLFRQQATTGKGFPDGEIERVASRLTGSNLTPFFNNTLRSTDELPLRETLAKAGLKYDEKITIYPFFGIAWDFSNSSGDSIMVDDVVPNGPGAKAGLQKGDTVTEIDHRPVSTMFGSVLQTRKPGDVLTLTITRSGASQALPLTLGQREERAVRLTTYTAPTPLQAAIFASVSGAAFAAKTP